MNYEKYLDAAGLTDPDLRAKCLAYLAQCESQYSAAGIRRAPLVMIKFSLLRGKS